MNDNTINCDVNPDRNISSYEINLGRSNETAYRRAREACSRRPLFPPQIARQTRAGRSFFHTCVWELLQRTLGVKNHFSYLIPAELNLRQRVALEYRRWNLIEKAEWNDKDLLMFDSLSMLTYGAITTFLTHRALLKT